MLNIGYYITQPLDRLEKINIDEIIKKISATSGKLYENINQLRNLMSIDVNAYKKHKTFLPYIVCGNFNPPYRKNENFTFIEYFILDIDHLSNINKTVESLKYVLRNDLRVLLVFASPSNDGLKIMFKFNQKCYDSAKYKLFFQEFAVQFSNQYNLSGTIDTRTSDVARACFLSYDIDIIFNSSAETIDIEPYVKNKFFQKGKLNTEINLHAAPIDEQIVNFDDDILKQIKQRLNPNLKIKEKNIFVPQELDNLMPLISQHINETGLTLTKIENIHYGKKIRIELGLKWAELNVFYGKKGYSVVKTPKNGSNSDLCEVAYQIVKNVIE